jgi:hypothetical protein
MLGLAAFMMLGGSFMIGGVRLVVMLGRLRAGATETDDQTYERE